MLRLPYILVQEEKPGLFEVISVEALTAPATADIQALLDDALVKAKPIVNTDACRFSAYTLVNPITSFFGMPTGDIRRQLRIDKDFFKDKAVRWLPEHELSSLTPRDGKFIVLLEILPKRARSNSGEEPTQRLKRSRLATTAPSAAAKPSVYWSIQQSSQKILDDRPEPDADIPPIPLLYDGFGHFLDIVDGSMDTPGLSDVDMTELQAEVDNFAKMMCKSYRDEDGRRSTGLPILNRIFSARAGAKIPSLMAAANGSVRTDGHNLGRHGAVITDVEFKNGPTNVSAIPEVEAVGYIARSHASCIDEQKDLFEGWRVPCLGLTVVGPDVKFYAVILVESQYRVVCLTPSLSCIPSASDGRDRNALYKAFAAASVLQAHILQDVEKFLVVRPPRIPDGTHHFPAISRLRKHDSTDFITFQILALHPDRQSYRHLYIAETVTFDKQRIMIKFVKAYSVELHNFCAERKHAPRLLAFEKLPSGWQALAMEFISPCYQIIKSPRLNANLERWTTELQTLVSAFHDKDLVHGDLRDANIICDDEDNVILVDFDWGGLEGNVFFPTRLLNEELVEGRNRTDLKICKEDDSRVLRRTLEKLNKSMVF